MARTRLTPIQVSNPYKFSAYNNTNEGIAGSTWQKVQMAAKEYDTSSNFDATTNYRFTAPIAGFYHFDLCVGGGAAGIGSNAYVKGALYKNGVVAKYGQQMQGSGNGNLLPVSQVSVTLQLAANDYIEAYIFCSETGRIVNGGQANTYLSGFLVSAT